VRPHDDPPPLRPPLRPQAPRRSGGARRGPAPGAKRAGGGRDHRRRPLRPRSPAPLRDRLRIGRASRLSRRPAAGPRVHRGGAVPQRRRRRAHPCPGQKPGERPPSHGRRSGGAGTASGRLAPLRLPPPPRSLAQGAACQAPHGQSWSARPDCGQAPARRRVPPRHRRSDLLPLVDDDHERPPRLRMAGGKRPRLPHSPRRLARDALRGESAPQGPRSLVFPLSEDM
ncbi:MAG: tRNA (guanine(46)-N(7))-methyltransferase, partial [uncultured Sphingosinicella sp.]